MDPKTGTLCCACLNSGPKIINVNDYWKKQCFLQIINEMSVYQCDSDPVPLCWLCYAHLTRFTKFKTQVKHSYRVFKEYINQNLTENSRNKLDVKPNLTSKKLFEISVDGRKNIFDIFSVYDGKENNVKPLDTKSEYLVCNEATIKDINDTNDDLTKINDINEFNELNDGVAKIKDLNEIDDTKLDYDEMKDVLFDDCGTDDEEVKTERDGRKKRRRKEELCVTIFLSRDEVLEERRLAKLEDNYVNAMFKCEKCIASFANAEDLSDHVTKKHGSHTMKKCEYCECTFNSLVSFYYHTKKHTRRYQCTLCNDRYCTERAITRHLADVHGAAMRLKHIQDKTEDKNRSNTPQQLHACELCSKTFRWKTSLRKHSEKHRIDNGQKRRPYCEPCQLSFTNSVNLQKHLKTSSKHQIRLKLWKLKQSPSSEVNQAQLEQIKCSVLDSKQLYDCPHCDKTFQWRGNRARHLSTHTARINGDLVCEPCNKTFSSKATYKQHLETSKKHVTEKDLKYMCSHCGKRFATKTHIRDHINWEHLKKFTHTCSHCQKVFKTHTSLYIHNQVYHKKDSTEHLCHHCGKSFPSHAKLNVHIRSAHKKAGTFRCDVCGAKFSWSSCLSRHINKVHAKITV